MPTASSSTSESETIPTAKVARGPSIPLLVVLAALGAGAGGWFGGPLVAPRIAEMVSSGGGEGGDSHGGGGGGGHGGGGSEEAVAPITIDNLILNPADSNGSRFLIATLVLDADESARAELEARDAEARDLLLTVLAIRTVDQLANIGLREEIREDLRAALNTMLGRDAVHRIFLPQFVIQ